MVTRADKYTEKSQYGNRYDLYADFLGDFSTHPEKNDLNRITNENSVKRAIRNLIFTNKYERRYQPAIGSDIQKLLFENITPEVTYSLKERIKNVIINYEPRCKLIDVSVVPRPDDNAYIVTITFYVVNKETPIEMQVSLVRVR